MPKIRDLCRSESSGTTEQIARHADVPSQQRAIGRSPVAFALRYTQMSALLRVRPARAISSRQMEREIQQHYAADLALQWEPEKSEVRITALVKLDGITAVMQSIADNASTLKDYGIDLLVIDTLKGLPKRKIPAFADMVNNIWCAGFEIALVTQNDVVHFDEMQDIVSTNHFIRIYLESIWNEPVRRPGTWGNPAPTANIPSMDGVVQTSSFA
jgi:hypothetical protein